MIRDEAKILIFDIETSPNIGYTWGKYEQNVIEFTEDWHMLSFAYKWLGDKKTHAWSLPDFKNYKKDLKNDYELTKVLWTLFNEADVIIAHNGDQFDIKKANALFIRHGFTPPSSYKTIDTKKVAKRYFKFDSNKLDDLGKYLGLGRKLQHSGFELWKGCMAGNMKDWKEMVAYNIQDVILLEKVYLKLRGWMNNHPNLNLFNGSGCSCPNCGSEKMQKRGFSITRTGKYQRWACQSCGAWSTGERIGDLVKIK